MCVPFGICAISDDDHPADVHIEAAAQRPVALMSTCTTSVHIRQRFLGKGRCTPIVSSRQFVQTCRAFRAHAYAHKPMLSGICLASLSLACIPMSHSSTKVCLCEPRLPASSGLPTVVMYVLQPTVGLADRSGVPCTIRLAKLVFPVPVQCCKLSFFASLCIQSS